jgi:hypothetical protein
MEEAQQLLNDGYPVVAGTWEYPVSDSDDPAVLEFRRAMFGPIKSEVKQPRGWLRRLLSAIARLWR